MKNSAGRSSAVSLSVLVAIAVALAAKGTASIWQGQPPAIFTVQIKDCELHVADPSTIRCHIRAKLEDQEISFKWYYDTPTGSKPFHTNPQVESVSYWPTEVVSLSELQLVVAGKRSNGNTVIEYWTVSYPPQPEPIVSQTTGETVYPDYVAPITRRGVYDRAVTGADMVYMMFEAQGHSALKVFVQFWDSRDLYLMNLQDESATKVASPNSGGGAPLVIPALANERKSRWSGEHVTQGYVYCLVTTGHTDNSTGGSLFLFDTNKDGSIDSWLQVSDYQEIVDLGLDEPSNWISMGT